MLNLFASRDQNIKNDVLSGVTVALALVPEAVAFAFVAGVSPIIGLYSAFFLGLITAIFGGRPGMISGATGAMAVIVVTLVAQHGIEYLFPAVILCGIVQIIVGLCRLGMLIRMVPHPVMLGFVNGLAIVIGMAQFGSFKTVNNLGQLTWMTGPALWIMLVLIGVTMSIIWLLPKFTRAVPASLTAILFGDVPVRVPEFDARSQARRAESETCGSDRARYAVHKCYRTNCGEDGAYGHENAELHGRCNEHRWRDDVFSSEHSG
jgi:SulP family sulfate permease